MYQKRCVGCGNAFEAVKPNRKWCSDTCGKRTRRRTSPASQPPVPVRRVDGDEPDPYVQSNRDIAEALGVSLPAELVAALASDDDDRSQNTEDEVAAVALRLADRFQSAVRGRDWRLCEQLMQALQDLMDDFIDARVVALLAA